MKLQDYYRREKVFPQDTPDLKAYIIESRLLRKVRLELEDKVVRPLELAFGDATGEILYQLENQIQKLDREPLRSAEAAFDTYGIIALIKHLREEQRRAAK